MNNAREVTIIRKVFKTIDSFNSAIVKSGGIGNFYHLHRHDTLEEVMITLGMNDINFIHNPPTEIIDNRKFDRFGTSDIDYRP